MKIFSWLIRVPLVAIIAVAKYPLAIIGVLFFSAPDKLHLTQMQWLETIDSDLTGDSGWRELHLWGTDPLAWYNRVRWLYRNGGGRVSFNLLGCPDDPVFNFLYANLNMSGLAVRWDGHWQYRKRFLIGGRYFEPFIGWGLYGASHGRCKFECSVRWRKNPT